MTSRISQTLTNLFWLGTVLDMRPLSMTTCSWHSRSYSPTRVKTSVTDWCFLYTPRKSSYSPSVAAQHQATRKQKMVNSSVTDMTFRQFFVLPGILQKKWLASNTFHWVYQAHLSIRNIHMKFHQILLNGSRENELTVSVTDMTWNGRSFFTYI